MLYFVDNSMVAVKWSLVTPSKHRFQFQLFQLNGKDEAQIIIHHYLIFSKKTTLSTHNKTKHKWKHRNTVQIDDHDIIKTTIATTWRVFIPQFFSNTISRYIQPISRLD